MSVDSDKIELLIKRIKYTPSREWMSSYFDLVKRVLDIAGLSNHSPRLVMSLSPNSSGWHFPVSINNRYVIALRKKRENEQTKLFVGLIFSHFSREIGELASCPGIGKWGQFKNLRGEYTDPPYFLRFGNFPEILYLLETSEEVRLSWSEAIVSEVERAKSSPYRKFHEPLMYQMATDINFRARVLDAAYVDSKPLVGLLPEEIDTPQEFYEGASRPVTINAYERNSQARNACIEYYGAECRICGMNFYEKYGDIGEGFIHVHHIKPLGEIGEKYKVDPIKDLCPVCPNCHAMIHMRKPPYGIEELKAMLKC